MVGLQNVILHYLCRYIVRDEPCCLWRAEGEKGGVRFENMAAQNGNFQESDLLTMSV